MYVYTPSSTSPIVTLGILRDLTIDLAKISVFTIVVTVVICASSWPLWKLFDRNLFNRKRTDNKEEEAECHLCEGPQNGTMLNP